MPDTSSAGQRTSPPTRIPSIDALRGFVMFMMIFVNDLAGAGRVVPDWMVHFSDRHHGGSGMTFVDLVFPAFLFIVGLSIPVTFSGRLTEGHSEWRIMGHVSLRTLSLLFIGILMVHETPDTAAMGWSGHWWCVFMYFWAITAFCAISPPISASKEKQRLWGIIFSGVRLGGLAALIWLAFAFRGPNGQRIITLAPFRLDTEWYGILGLIGWAYLVAATVFLVFRENRTAILGCMTLLMCLFVADRSGLFEGFWLNGIVGIGETLGSQAAIAVGGLFLGTMLATGTKADLKTRTKLTLGFIAGCMAGALLLNRAYGISKNAATPSWCLWACVVTAVLWYGFHIICDVRPTKLARPLVLAGQNVLLPYLISEMLPRLLEVLGLSGGYDHLASTLASAITRSALCGVIILIISSSLNGLGFRLKL